MDTPVVPCSSLRMPTKSSMEALPTSTDSGTLAARSAATKARLDHQPQQIFNLLARGRETTDEELELIERRYQQMLALKNLEDLFAEGHLDCM
jgi:hypothetical protein